MVRGMREGRNVKDNYVEIKGKKGQVQIELDR